MRISLVQNSPSFGEKEKNAAELVSAMESAPSDLYILPELAYTGYQFTSTKEAWDLADERDSPFLDIFKEAAARLDACLVLGFPERSGGTLFNSSLAILPGGESHLYRKTHLFYKEKLFFSPGDLGFSVFEFRGAWIGQAICFDWFFPESFRTLARLGADLVAHSSNLVMPYCQQADFAQAVQNRVYIATANRVGSESRDGETLTFTGASVLVSPRGEYLLSGPSGETAVLSADIDPTAARDKELNPYNGAFADRRPEYYFLG
ncbi:MAG TPA: nitrilase-related carbon-nitrogen hydrolase [Rectinemataceae bacterium]